MERISPALQLDRCARSPLPSRRAILRGGLGVGLAAVLAACAGSQSAPGGAGGGGTTGGQPVKLVQLSRRAGGSEGYTLQQKLADDYHRVAPNVTIEVVPGTVPQEQIVVRHAGGDPVDFVENDWGIWVDLAEGKVIEDLTPYFVRDKIDPNTFLGESLLTYTYQNRRYAVPVSMSVDGLFYNEELFQANNVPPPPQNPADRTWTMEKFLEVAVKLTKPGEQWGFGGSYNCFNTNGVTDGTYFG